MRPAFRLAAIAAACFLAACVYRMDIQQGNLLDAEQVDQLEVGMTRSQVRFLLGTPMVPVAFDDWFDVACAHDPEDRFPDAQTARHRQVRVIDQSGEDYLYPKTFFASIELPRPVRRAVLAAT